MQSPAEYYQVRAAVQSLSSQVAASFPHVVASLMCWVSACMSTACRWQHQTSDSLTKAISCPTVDAAAAAAAAVIGSCTAGTAHAGSTSAAGLAATATDTGLLGQQPPEAAAGPVLTALLSILRWADVLGATTALAAAGSAPAQKRSSAGPYERPRWPAALCFNVVLDERQHGTQSLLHSGLSRLQGMLLHCTHTDAGTCNCCH